MVVKKSLNPVPSSLRGKKRYVLFRLSSSKNLSMKEVENALWNLFFELFGEVGTARQKLWLIGFNSKKGLGILRCSLDHTEEVKAGILFFKEVSGLSVVPEIVRVSGSLSKLEKAAEGF